VFTNHQEKQVFWKTAENLCATMKALSAPGLLAFAMRKTSPRLRPAALFAVIALAAVAIPALVAAGLPETPLLWALPRSGICDPQVPATHKQACGRVRQNRRHVFLRDLPYPRPGAGLAFPHADAASLIQCLLLVLLPGSAALVYR
jgi:hypothetical protein